MREPAPIWPEAPRRAPWLEFPPYRFVPGLHPHPRRDPAGHSHGRPDLPVEQAFDAGVDLYHAGYLWEAHEAWEVCWKASTVPAEREHLRGLIQLTAAVLKAHMGEARGARQLAEAARRRLRPGALSRAVDAWIEAGLPPEDPPRLPIDGE
jgi:hypothetical protein